MNLDLVKFLPDSSGLFSKLKNDNVLVTYPKEKTAKLNRGGVKFFSCAIISKPDGNELKAARKNFDFVCVAGSSPQVCAWAANQKVDLLIQPFSSDRNFIDSQTASVLAQNNVFVGIFFAEFLQSAGAGRQLLIKNASQCIKVIANSGVKTLFFSGARDESGLRAVKDLDSFGVLLGLSEHDSKKIVRENPAMFLGRLK